MKLNETLKILLLAVIGTVVAMPASAITQYSYIGGVLDTLAPGSDHPQLGDLIGNRVVGSFWTDNVLSDGTYDMIALPPDGFVYLFGYVYQTPTIASIFEITIANGNLSDWNIVTGGTGCITESSCGGSEYYTSNTGDSEYYSFKGFRTGATGPSGAWSVSTVANVPEPEIYTMMLAGLGLLGFIAHRRS